MATGRHGRKPIRQGRLGFLLAVALLSGVLHGGAPARAESPTIDLYVDAETGQVFTQPGKNRTKLGTFQRVDEPAKRKAKAPATAKPAAERKAVVAETPASEEAAKPTTAEAKPAETKPAEAEHGDATVVAAVGKVLKGKWYERISLRGYTQFRYNALLDKEDNGVDWFAPADRSVQEATSLFIRRGRLIFSGDVTDHLYVYVQPDLNALPADGDFSLQLRDLYADVAVDKKKEFRFRVGQSKVPFGWVNMQSSQNRLALERPDPLNSAVEGERDVGIFFYWAPQEIRDRLRDLVRSGLKGSGDYGVLALGMYNGQGLNRLDTNNGMHWIARLTYPFKFANGQIFEPGIQGYWGNFVTRTRAIEIGGQDVTPSAPKGGLTDRRGGVSAVLYPQPFGLEAEWNIGEGPELSNDQRSIKEEFLHGGYVQATYKYDFDYGTLFPFVRWQYYDGGRKFARNAPQDRVNEWDFGLEWSPIHEIELATIYTYTPYRTNTNDAPYREFKNASRLGLQFQWNY